MLKYSVDFYDDLGSTAAPAARKILPLILDIVPVQSVIDFGCGDGGWLSVLRNEFSVTDVLGLDGPWVEESQLQVPVENFRCVDMDKRIEVEGRYDLAISLEVAEHLPARRAVGFVEEITQTAPVVLFSAAIPGQRGVHHVNEQWQSYWADLFAKRGYRSVDIVRGAVWTDPQVAVWYKQNTLLYASSDALNEYPRLASAVDGIQAKPLDIVHPELFARAERNDSLGLGGWIRMAPGAVRKSIGRRIKKYL